MQKTEIRKFRLLTHLAICGLGYMGAIFAFTCYYGDIYFDRQNNLIPYTGWAFGALAVHKGVLLFAYLTGIVGLFVYLTTAIILNNRLNHRCAAAYKPAMNRLSYYAFLIVVNVVLLMAFWVMTELFILALLLIIWLVLLLFPVRIYEMSAVVYAAAKQSMHFSKLYFSLLLGCGVIALLIAFSPYFKLSALQVSNDYMWVPEKTYLKNEVVDNNHFIMSHGVGGLYREGLIHAASDIELKRYNYVLVNNAGNIDKYLGINKYLYGYIPSLNVLFIKKEKFTGEDNDLLCSLVGSDVCQVATFRSVAEPETTRKSAKQLHNFIQKNKYELAGQVLAGHYFHHQYAMLGPISELLLGKDPASIIYLYGLGNVQLLNYVFTNAWHGMTFENFTFTLYGFYLLYFALFIACCSLIFKDVRYVAITFASVIGMLFLISFELLRIAPGFNPLRHFLDIFVIMTFYGYLYSRRFNTLFLIGAIVFGLLAVYASKEFGLMMFFALLGASLAHIVFSSKRYLNVGWLLGSMVALYFILQLEGSAAGQNPMSIYSIMGVSVAPSRRVTDLFLLLSVFSCYVTLLFIHAKRGATYKPIYLCLYLLFYSQCLLVYYAWYTESGHLLSTAPIWVLFLVLMYREVSSLMLTKSQVELWLSIVGGGLASLLLLIGSAKYFTQQYHYGRIFKDHVVYQWNFPGAHFKSTMDPSVFQEGVDLINQYSQGNSIYLISKYDNFLPYLAGKYSAMPFLELSTSLVTDHEVDTAANAILTAAPKYLFVDSDIETNNVGDILDPANPLQKDMDRDRLSKGRVTVLNESKRVFKRVSSNYQLIKSGYLVSVYEHK